MHTRHIVIGLAFITCGRSLLAQHVSIDAALRASDGPYVQAIGEATVSAKPDQAIIDIGVVTQGPTATSVAAQNAKQTDAVLADLRQIPGISQLKTTSFRVSPNYKNPKPGAATSIEGYTALNLVQVVLIDLTQVGKVIDTTLQSGANQIQKLQFGLTKPQAPRAQALREAAAQAKANAEAIVAGLDVHLVRVLSVEQVDSETNFANFAPPKTAPTDTLPVPSQVEAGTIDVRAMILLRVEVGK